jgi:hypothetical protein
MEVIWAHGKKEIRQSQKAILLVVETKREKEAWKTSRNMDEGGRPGKQGSSGERLHKTQKR